MREEGHGKSACLFVCLVRQLFKCRSRKCRPLVPVSPILHMKVWEHAVWRWHGFSTATRLWLSIWIEELCAFSTLFTLGAGARQGVEFLLCALQEMSEVQVSVEIASALQNKMKIKRTANSPPPHTWGTLSCWIIDPLFPRQEFPLAASAVGNAGRYSQSSGTKPQGRETAGAGGSFAQGVAEHAWYFRTGVAILPQSTVLLCSQLAVKCRSARCHSGLKKYVQSIYSAISMSSWLACDFS